MTLLAFGQLAEPGFRVLLEGGDMVLEVADSLGRGVLFGLVLFVLGECITTLGLF